ncbi:MAG TPA: SRPBCC family protein [Intrasporangium sp.]|uniref:SRPBCC family protein n=1 Tax=Intrasporangium sp. TaxID=1925024 RepID=UPI002D79D620|nr:SRPBCC family protein [Intrasporangium sp.]HET7398155.1 SRPBCC family protein [Intrasporangium sp.]
MAETYTVSRSTTIDAPSERIHPLLNDFRRWREWSPWEGLDPDMKRVYGGSDSGPGATYEWSGNRRAGKGRMRIATSTPTEVGIDLAFDKPFKSENRTTFTLVPRGGATDVTWSMTGRNNAVMRLLGKVMSMDKMIGKDYDKGLANLKAVAERG